MKIIINLPKRASALASMMMADEFEQEKIDAAIERCEQQPTEIDMDDLAKTSGADNSDLQSFNIGLAIIAIAKAIEVLKENNHPKDE